MCILREKFNSYVSDLFTCKSSECCFVLAIWCPGNPLSLSFEVFSPHPRIRKQWFANIKKSWKKCSSESPIFLPKGSNFIQNPYSIKFEFNSNSVDYILVFLIDTALEVTDLFLVGIKVHTCTGWRPQTDPKERWQALQDEVRSVWNPVYVDKASDSRKTSKKSGFFTMKTSMGFPS